MEKINDIKDTNFSPEYSSGDKTVSKEESTQLPEINIDTEFEVLEIDAVNNNIIIMIKNKQGIIGINAAKKIFVEEKG